MLSSLIDIDKRFNGYWNQFIFKNHSHTFQHLNLFFHYINLNSWFEILKAIIISLLSTWFVNVLSSLPSRSREAAAGNYILIHGVAYLEFIGMGTFSSIKKAAGKISRYLEARSGRKYEKFDQYTRAKISIFTSSFHVCLQISSAFHLLNTLESYNSSYRPGGLPYKSDGGDRRKFWKDPPKGTRILFCGRGPNNYFTLKRNQISWLAFTSSHIFWLFTLKGTTIPLTEVI